MRFYSEDNCSKSILVDEKTTVVQTCERLVVKNNVTPSENWAVVEHLPELYMGMCGCVCVWGGMWPVYVLCG